MQLAMHELAFIGLGSNLGNCFENLKNAVQLIETTFNTSTVTSSVYRSEPLELTDQPWFLNQVVAFTPGPELGPVELLRQLKLIEEQMGRTPGPRYGPRIIDLDLLIYKNWVFECDWLIIPHDKLEQRSFVLQPLAEIAPDLINPRTGLSMAATLELQQTKLSFCEKTASDQAS
ncbi:MAG TPA: 2-amino-4-hydroxy-6-hydroxymethyldihydropteridine diphosphokinase [Bacillota bacterium]|nr:2-amino-4-hydroxy-6-hydroxymethyldihydropteridine diphosphokinase [Bacillota bacterium]